MNAEGKTKRTEVFHRAQTGLGAHLLTFPEHEADGQCDKEDNTCYHWTSNRSCFETRSRFRCLGRGRPSCASWEYRLCRRQPLRHCHRYRTRRRSRRPRGLYCWTSGRRGGGGRGPCLGRYVHQEKIEEKGIRLRGVHDSEVM